MPVDFTQIESGEEFELLCEDLLQAMGFSIVQQPTRGQEGGKDLIISEIVRDKMGFTEERKTLVQCKHKARSGKAVGFGEVANYRDAMDQYKVQRYLLITSTLPTEDVRTKFEATSKKGDYIALVWSKGDLARFLDEHPDVRERYFPSEAEAPTPAGALAERVEGLLTVMGFTCQERQAAADRVRLVCTSKGAFARPVAVVCKEGAVERGDVEALIAQVKAQDLGGGVLVTHTRVSPAARKRAAETEGAVRAFTLDEFYRELIDFEGYVRTIVTDYEDDELSTYYVDLGCRSGDGSAYKPMDDYVDRWLDDPARNHISVLGDYGTGKTSFCQQYAAKLGRRWLADPDRHRIPILISLRDYAKAMNLEQLVTDFLVNRYGIQAGYDAFIRFNADGKLVLLFDGFDEMAQKVDYQTTVDNFEELARAVEARSKVVLTCRTPYFRSRREAEELLSRRDDLPESSQLLGRLIDLTDRPNFEIVHLLPFDGEDIQAMLRARFPDEWEGYYQQIEHTYNLAELAQRPVLLDMIARSLPELEPEQAVNAARLYEAYTDLWLARDEEKGRKLITRADKRLFMQELALAQELSGVLRGPVAGAQAAGRQRARDGHQRGDSGLCARLAGRDDGGLPPAAPSGDGGAPGDGLGAARAIHLRRRQRHPGGPAGTGCFRRPHAGDQRRICALCSSHGAPGSITLERPGPARQTARPPGCERELARCRGLRPVGRSQIAHRAGVGESSAGDGWAPLPLGR